MKKIPLTKGQVALVDDEDYEMVSRYKWYTQDINKTLYAQRMIVTKGTGKRVTMFMHRLIMNTPQGMDTDHIDRNGLNNQKSNLRICTRTQNLLNRGMLKSNTSGYKGVYLDIFLDKFVCN